MSISCTTYIVVNILWHIQLHWWDILEYVSIMTVSVVQGNRSKGADTFSFLCCTQTLVSFAHYNIINLPNQQMA